jgi:hypothetical protein
MSHIGPIQDVRILPVDLDDPGWILVIGQRSGLDQASANRLSHGLGTVDHAELAE